MASREDVIVKFGGDAKALTRTLGTIRSEVSAMTGGFGQLQGILSAAGITAGLTAIKNSLSWADDLSETAGRVGLTTDAVQALRLEAELFGVTTQDVDAALTKFSINLGKARQGTGDLYEIFKKYNQSLEGTATEVLERYIILLQQAKSEAEQNRIAVAGFGKAGASMAQALAESGKPMDEIISKFRELGLVMDEEMIQRAAELNDEYDRLIQQLTMKWHEFALGLSEIGNSLGDQLSLAGKRAEEEWDAVVGYVSGRIETLGEALKAFDQARINMETAMAAPKWTEGNPKFIGPPKPSTIKKVRLPGDQTEEGEKKIDDALKAREAAKDAARLKDMTAAQRQWELESRILRAMNEEKEALAKKDEERARKAQEAQEAALQKLIADPITPDYVVDKYAKMVKAIESAPGPEVKMRINWEELDRLPQKLQDAIRAPGSGYVIDMTVQVHPVLSGDSYLLLESDIERQPVGPMPADITKEADAAGANP